MTILRIVIASLAFFGILFWSNVVVLVEGRPCVRLVTSVEEGSVIAKLNRKNSSKMRLQTFGRRFVTSLDFDYTEPQKLYGILNGQGFVSVGWRRARVNRIGGTGVEQIQGMAISQHGVVYVYSAADTAIYEINKMDGSATELFTTDVPDLIDLAYSYQRDFMYATDGEILYTIDPMRNSTRRVGSMIRTLPRGTGISGLVVAPKGGIYGLTNATQNATIVKILRNGTVASNNNDVVTSLSSQAIGGTMRCASLPPNVVGTPEPSATPTISAEPSQSPAGQPQPQQPSSSIGNIFEQ